MRVRARCGKGAAARLDKGCDDRRRRTAKSNRAIRRLHVYRHVFTGMYDEGERPGPEGLRKRSGYGIDPIAVPIERIDSAHEPGNRLRKLTVLDGKDATIPTARRRNRSTVHARSLVLLRREFFLAVPACVMFIQGID